MIDIYHIMYVLYVLHTIIVLSLFFVSTLKYSDTMGGEGGGERKTFFFNIQCTEELGKK